MICNHTLSMIGLATLMVLGVISILGLLYFISSLNTLFKDVEKINKRYYRVVTEDGYVIKYIHERLSMLESKGEQK